MFVAVKSLTPEVQMSVKEEIPFEYAHNLTGSGVLELPYTTAYPVPDVKVGLDPARIIACP